MIVLLIGLPTIIFFYAVVPAYRALKATPAFLPGGEEEVYCFGGLSFPHAVTSTLGSVLTTGSVVMATLGALFMAGSAPFVAWIIGGVFVFPILLYLFLSSKEVEKYFSDSAEKIQETGKTVVSFVGSNYGPRATHFIYIAFMVAICGLLFIEMAFALLWTEHLLGSRFSSPWLIATLWFVVSFLYVYAGGYSQTLRTDYLQFIILFAVSLFVILKLAAVFAPNFDLWVEFTRIYSNFVTEDWLAWAATEKKRQATSASALQVNVFGGLGAFFVMGCWFASGPDVWNRLIRWRYFSPEKENEREGKGFRTLGGVIVLVALGFFFADLLTGYLGVFGFEKTSEIDFDPAFIMDAPYLIFSTALGYLTAPSANDGFAPLLGTVNTGTFTVIALLLFISTLTMTTLDTTLMSIAQMTRDWGQNAKTNHRQYKVDDLRRIVLIAFLTALVAVLGLYAWRGFSELNVIASIVGILVCGSLAVFFIVMFICRVFFPWAFKGDDKTFVVVFLTSIIFGKGFTTAATIYGWCGFGFCFERGSGSGAGSVLMLEAIIHTLAILVGVFYIKLKRFKLKSA